MHSSLTHFEVSRPHPQSSRSIVVRGVDERLLGRDDDLVARVGRRVLRVTIDGQRTLKLGNIHLLAVCARLDEDHLLASRRR